MLRRSVQLLLSSENDQFEVFSEDLELGFQLWELETNRKNQYFAPKINIFVEKSSKTTFFVFDFNCFHSICTNSLPLRKIQKWVYNITNVLQNVQKRYRNRFGKIKISMFFDFLISFLDLDCSGCFVRWLWYFLIFSSSLDAKRRTVERSELIFGSFWVVGSW